MREQKNVTRRLDARSSRSRSPHGRHLSLVVSLESRFTRHNIIGVVCVLRVVIGVVAQLCRFSAHVGAADATDKGLVVHFSTYSITYTHYNLGYRRFIAARLRLRLRHPRPVCLDTHRRGTPTMRPATRRRNSTMAAHCFRRHQRRRRRQSPRSRRRQSRFSISPHLAASRSSGGSSLWAHVALPSWVAVSYCTFS